MRPSQTELQQLWLGSEIRIVCCPQDATAQAMNDVSEVVQHTWLFLFSGKGNQALLVLLLHSAQF